MARFLETRTYFDPMTKRILNLGAGVQSTTIAIMAQMNAEAAEVGQPMPYPLVGLVEFAIFGDTGDEPWKVYLHLCWLVERCRSIRFLVRSIHPKRNRILHRLFPTTGPFDMDRARRFLAWLRRIPDGTLRGSLLRGNAPTGRSYVIQSTGERFASIPAFSWDGVTVRMTRRNGHVPDESKTKRQCTSEWKIDAVERSIRRDVFGLAPGRPLASGVSVTQVLGLSFDEPGRIVKVRRRFQLTPWATVEFPLFEMEQTRGGCKMWLRKYGPPYEVARSACTECPLHGNEEWREMRDSDPVSWEEACATDDGMRAVGANPSRGMTQKLFLHRSCVPLREAPIDEVETKKMQEVFGFVTECEGMCGV